MTQKSIFGEPARPKQLDHFELPVDLKSVSALDLEDALEETLSRLIGGTYRVFVDRIDMTERGFRSRRGCAQIWLEIGRVDGEASDAK